MRNSFLAVLFALSVAVGCSTRQPEESAEPAPEARPPVEVRVARAETRDLERSLLVTGSLYPDETVSLSFEVPGRVAAVHFDFGQYVRKGQVVAELDRREFQLQLERAKGALAQTLARIGLEPSAADRIPDSTPAIRQAEAQLQDAEFKYRNAEKLVASGDIARDRYQELKNAYEARQAALDAARDEFRVQLATLQSLRADVGLAEKRLSDTTLQAPFDGLVGERQASPGQYMKENTPVVRLVKAHPLRLRVDVPEVATAAVRPGSELSFTTDAAPGEEFRAIVRQLDPALDARSRSLVAEARLLKEDARLKPGMFVRVRLVTEKGASATMVPKQALYSIAGLTKVFSVEDGKAVEHRVAPGRELDGWVEVPPVIRPGDSVALNNLPDLITGAPVTVVEASAELGKRPAPASGS